MLGARERRSLTVTAQLLLQAGRQGEEAEGKTGRVEVGGWVVEKVDEQEG